jgi:5-methylcytosine-specific restriction endonuclease McrA
MGRTLRSKRKRRALRKRAGNRCELCGEPLAASFHADHTTPWVVVQRTYAAEMQALCPTCNLKKGAKQ